jgi:hypothetical protein
MSLAEMCAPHGGIYKFALTPRVLKWTVFLSQHADYLDGSVVPLDFSVFLDPVFSTNPALMRDKNDTEKTTMQPHRLDRPSKQQEPDTTMEMGGDGSEQWKDVVEDDMAWRSERDRKAFGEEDAMQINDERQSSCPPQKRKSPEIDDDDKQPPPFLTSTKRMKTVRLKLPPAVPASGERPAKYEEQYGAGAPIRDCPTEPGLKVHPSACAHCLSSRVICYKASVGKCCDWCRRLKQTCTFLSRAADSGSDNGDGVREDEDMESGDKRKVGKGS